VGRNIFLSQWKSEAGKGVVSTRVRVRCVIFLAGATGLAATESTRVDATRVWLVHPPRVAAGGDSVTGGI
jgi:hypothetical protein